MPSSAKVVITEYNKPGGSKFCVSFEYIANQRESEIFCEPKLEEALARVKELYQSKKYDIVYRPCHSTYTSSELERHGDKMAEFIEKAREIERRQALENEDPDENEGCQ